MNEPGVENIKTSQIAPNEGKGENLQVEENKNEQGQEIQLFVEGKDLVDLDFFSVSDPICSLKTKEALVEHATWQWNGDTEVIDNNLNPKWIKHFNVWYNFVKDVDLHF